MAAKPTHVKRMAELLASGDYDTPEELAKAAINLVDELRANDRTYAVVSQYGRFAYLGVHPFATALQAEKALKAGRVPVTEFGIHAIVPMLTPTAAAARLDEADLIKVNVK